MEQAVTITSVEFRNYKGLQRYSLSLRDLNILVGPNNCGKSTIIGAFRALATGLRKARARNPEQVVTEEGIVRGYSIPTEQLAISIENVHTNYSDVDSSVIFRLSNGNKLRLLFPDKGGCYLIPEPERKYVSSPTTFKAQFPLTLAVVPVLGPLDHDEAVVEAETVQRNLHTHRASRHFRNFWIYYPEHFEAFAKLIASTWPGIEIERPERVGDVVRMFCLENRITRELFWAGFGFQIWCQLLTHLSNAQNESMIIIDEPEIYLHPDLQRQLLSILRSAGPAVLIATHSTEIMSEADASEIILIDKSKLSANRLRDVVDVQFALEQVGSIQNISLTRLAKNRRVLYVEGNDYSILMRLARVLNLDDLASGTQITALPCGGFAGWQRVRDVAWGINQTLGSPLMIGAILDRDYHCEEEIKYVESELGSAHLHFSHVHKRKEIENYLLTPSVIHRALKNFAREDLAIGNLPSESKIEEILDSISNEIKSEILGQYVAKRAAFLKSSPTDQALIAADTVRRFEARWTNVYERIAIIPGKEILKRLRLKFQEDFGITLTTHRIVSAMHKDEIPIDLKNLLLALDDFRKLSVSSNSVRAS